MINIIDDIITNEECDLLIDLYNKNQHLLLRYNSTYTLDITSFYLEKLIIADILEKIIKSLKPFNFNIALDWAQIVKWPKDSYQDLHFDTASNETVFTSITYLNESFGGGNTYFDDGTHIGIKTARTVAFDGLKYKHGVKHIVDGNRFTVATWYKKEKSYLNFNKENIFL